MNVHQLVRERNASREHAAAALEQPAPFGATWELRFGPGNRFRVFYEVESDTRVINVLAIGMKERNKLLIGGEEFEP